jgi:acetyl-CoA acetyltransferase
VWVEASGCALDSHDLGMRDLSRASSLGMALSSIARAVSPDDLDIIELSEPSIYHLFAMAREIFPDITSAEVVNMISDGRINPSGGALAATTLVACGLFRVVFASLQLRGEAGPFQAGTPQLALAHGASGAGAQSSTIFLLSI